MAWKVFRTVVVAILAAFAIIMVLSTEEPKHEAPQIVMPNANYI